MTSIVLSSAVRQNLLSLQDTAASLATTQNALSTGKKVNSALDNPTNFFTAAGLDNRASDISDLLDGISNGVQVLQSANTGLTSLQSLVSQAKSIANQALQTSIGYSTKSSFTSSAIQGATAQNLLGTPSSIALTSAAGANGDSGANSGKIDLSSSLTTSASADSVATTLTASDNLVINGKTIAFSASGGAATSISATGATINVGTGTVNDIVNAINTITGTTTASLSAGGVLTLNTGTTSGGLSISATANVVTDLGLGTLTPASALAGTATPTAVAVSSTAQTLVGPNPFPNGSTLSIAATGNGVATSVTFGTGAGQVSTLNQLNAALAVNNLQATIDGTTGAITIATTNDAASSTIGAVSVTGTGNKFTAISSPPAPVADATSQATRTNLVSQYNALLTQIDNTAADSSYNGVNLLNGDQLQLTFNETGKSKLSITGVQDSSAGLGLSQLSSTAFKDNTGTNAVIATLSTVSTNLRSQASAFGSNLSVVQTRQDFNKNLINVLQTGSANLTQADINLEAANSQALTTRQSLSVSALSLANQSQQSVLQLLR